MKTFDNGFVEGVCNEMGCLYSGFIFILLIGAPFLLLQKACNPDEYKKSSEESRQTVGRIEESVDRNKRRIKKARKIFFENIDQYLDLEEEKEENNQK